MKALLLLVFIIITSIESMTAVLRYELPSAKVITELSLNIAISQNGISNAKNPDVIKQYLNAAGVGYYNPFCMSGQYWSFVKAKQIIDYVNLMFGFNIPNKIPIPKTALANKPFFYAKKNGTLTAYKPQRNDLIIWFVSNTINGHIERIISVNNDGWVTTIAFNTDNREVKFKKRHITNPLGTRLVRGLVGFKYE